MEDGGVGDGHGPARLVVLDGLRLLAVLMVVAYHYVAFGSEWGVPRGEAFPGLYRPAAYGWLGVPLFFLISGFVICLSCWGRSLSEFFTSRVVRLFPAYWFGVAATTAVVAAVPGGTGPRRWQDVLTNLTMLEYPLGAPYVDGVYWSLWVEARFYLLFAVVVWLGVSYRRVLAFCLLWSVAGVVATALPGVAWLQLVAMPEHCWFFVGGLAFHLMWRSGPDLLLWLLVGFSFLAGCRGVRPTYRFAAAHAEAPLPEWGVVVLLAVCYLLMAGVALGWFRRVRGRWLTAAGAVTYPLYLLHQYIGWEVIVAFRGRVAPWVLAVGLVVVLTAVSWLVQRYVERPVGRWMKGRLRAALAKGALPEEQADRQPDRQAEERAGRQAEGVGVRR
ncbi:acyltransferase family protein [Kitasatospora sp. McL0602]|uniref:acyltransferase family protein n=1 Tax=Kitasatospora sp. McL0602 TaxID=3439530 RepID=UPI003F8A6129